MAASLSSTIVDAAPGNIITISGSGLTGGSGASVTLNGQGVFAQPGLAPQIVTLPAVFAGNGSSVSITVPDGVMSGTLTVTASDATIATCALRACSQYVQSSEYLGEGEPVSSLVPGELDIILRRASALCDTIMGDSVRILQVLDSQRYRNPRVGAPVVRPYRCRGRRCPLLTVDQLTFISAADLITVFNTNDIFINQSMNYIEILAYAVGNYALLGELQVIGYSANVLEIAYTSGFTMAQYPIEVRTATILTATNLLNHRRRQKMGMGPFSKFEDKLVADPDAIRVPDEARRLLAPYTVSTLA